MYYSNNKKRKFATINSMSLFTITEYFLNYAFVMILLPLIINNCTSKLLCTKRLTSRQ